MGREKTKKQHFVPQCYLKAWKMSDNREAVFVYDKEKDSFRKNSIEDIASERYFYDVDLINLLGEKQLLDLAEGRIRLRDDADPQLIEHTYADLVETIYKDILERMIKSAREATPWIINNCYFIMPEEKESLSALLAIQFLRTKQIRNDLIESSKLLEQSLRNMGFPEQEAAKYELSKEKAKNIHLQMLNDTDNLIEIATSFYYLTWVLCINRTRKKLYTSDSPIIRLEHIHDPIRGMNGLRSKGVEVFLPLAPDMVLVMFDGEYHRLTAKERRYAELNYDENIEYYNSATLQYCDRCTYSQDGDWALVKKMKIADQSVFSRPRIMVK